MSINKNSIINNSKNKIFKQLWMLGDKHLVVIDKSIIEKLGIKDDLTIFLEQDITHDHVIVMRVKNF